jgi:hypothetical protein
VPFCAQEFRNLHSMAVCSPSLKAEQTERFFEALELRFQQISDPVDEPGIAFSPVITLLKDIRQRRKRKIDNAMDQKQRFDISIDALLPDIDNRTDSRVAEKQEEFVRFPACTSYRKYLHPFNGRAFHCIAGVTNDCLVAINQELR